MRRVLGIVLSLGLAAAALSAPVLAQVPAAIAAAVADSSRPDADRMRDAERKPDQALLFSGIKAGDKVAELFPGGGYYTRLLAKAVGPTGHVYALVPDMPAPRPQGTQALIDIAKTNPNVTIVNGPFLGFAPAEKLDMVWTSENYHDFRNMMFGAIDPATLNKKIFDLLKPGGIFYIEDHAAAAGAGATVTNSLHRIDPATVRAEVEAAGFRLQGMSDYLSNPADDHSKVIFDPSIRGHTDKFVMRFQKPRR